MSTEAMRFSEWLNKEHPVVDQWGNRANLPSSSRKETIKLMEKAWQAATANQDALIRATVEQCAKVGEDFSVMNNNYLLDKYKTEFVDVAIRQITPEQILNSTK